MNGDPLDELDEQAAEITRLRGENEKLRGIIRIQDAAIRSDTATLTDAEREAIKAAIDCCEDITYGSEAEPEAAATLRALLARCALSTRGCDG